MRVNYFSYTDDTDLDFAEGYDYVGIAFRLKYSKDNKTFMQYGTNSVSCGVPLTDEEFVKGSNKITLPCDYNEVYLGTDVTIAVRNMLSAGWSILTILSVCLTGTRPMI